MKNIVSKMTNAKKFTGSRLDIVVTVKTIKFGTGNKKIELKKCSSILWEILSRLKYLNVLKCFKYNLSP